MASIRDLFAALLDLLFPAACLGCGADRTWLCISCRGGARSRREQRRDIAVICAQEPAAERAVRALYAVKYMGIRGALVPLTDLLAAALAEHMGTSQDLTLVPVITDANRRRERGFDQSRVIADRLGRILGIPVADILVRQRANRPQVGLDRAGRDENMRGIFGLRGPVPAARLILIDDVCTSGATFAAAAAVLREAGAVAIEGAALFGRIDTT